MKKTNKKTALLDEVANYSPEQVAVLSRIVDRHNGNYCHHKFVVYCVGDCKKNWYDPEDVYCEKCLKHWRVKAA